MSTNANNANKWSLYLIMGIPVLGVLLTTLYYFYVTGSGLSLGTHNKGELINPPKDIKTISLQQEGQAFEWDIKSGKWTILVVGQGACEKACQDELFLTRQLRTMQGKYMGRLTHKYLDLNNGLTAENKAWIAAEHPQLTVLNADSEAVKALFQQGHSLEALVPGHFYIVDPMGWIMMYYTPAHDYKQVTSDMKFLLKNS